MPPRKKRAAGPAAPESKDGAPLFHQPTTPKPPDLPVDEAAEDELGEELNEIYRAAGPEKPDMTRLDQARHSTLKKILVSLVFFLAFLAAVAWAGFFFFSPGEQKFSGEGVEIAVDGPAQVKSGDQVTYTVNYRNNERIPLGTANLEVRLPREFTVLKSDPTLTQDALQIGSIAPGKGGSVQIQGVFLAPVGKQVDLQVILTYRPADFNSEFQKVSTRSIGVADSVLDLRLTGPAKVMPGDKVTLDLSYLNTSDSEFKDAAVKLAYPPNFIPESADPASADDAKTLWNIGSAPPNTENHIKITGAFASDAKGNIDIKGQIGFTDRNGDFQLQKEATFTAEVVEGQLVVAMVLNGKTGDQSANFGDTLHYAITYRNTGNSTLEDVTLTAVLDPQPVPDQMVLWNGLHDKQQGLRNGNSISWNKKQITALGVIGPGDEGTIDFDVPLLAAPIEGAKSTDYRVNSWVQASIATIDNELVNRTTQTPPFAAVLASDAKLAGEARYFNADGLPVGSGPLPPVVGQATTYRVTWDLTNSLHDLTDLKISARLPSNAVWTGKSSVDAGDLKFDAAEEKIVWTLNWMPTTIKELKVSFDVALTPTADQAGKTPTLVDAAILEAVDKANGNPIILSLPPFSTALDNDELAAGKGKVQAQ